MLNEDKYLNYLEENKNEMTVKMLDGFLKSLENTKLLR